MEEVGKYKIVFHFEGTTLTKSFKTEEERDKDFDGIHTLLAMSKSFITIDDVIINAGQVLCISKSEEDESPQSIN